MIGLLTDPGNELPEAIRAAILSVGQSVIRAMDHPSPDFGFLIAVNDNIGAGLATGL